jgi:hypothetical protein
MHAIGVSDNRIMDWGLWSNPASLRKYIRDRATVVPFPADYKCFGWMPHSL